MPTIVKIVLCKSKAEIATICAHVLIFPNWFAATTSPVPARIKRRPVTANSRLIITITIQDGANSSSTNRINAAEDSLSKEEEQLKNVIARLDKLDENNEAVLFNKLQSEYTTIVNARTKNNFAPAILPLPIETFKWKEVGTVRWQDVVKYLFY